MSRATREESVREEEEEKDAAVENDKCCRRRSHATHWKLGWLVLCAIVVGGERERASG